LLLKFHFGSLTTNPSPLWTTGGKTQSASAPPVEGVAGGGTSYGWVDGGLRGTSLGAGVIDPTKVHSEDLLHVWSMPSTANVSQQEAPRPLEKVSCITFYPHLFLASACD